MASSQGGFNLPALPPPPGVTPHFINTGTPNKNIVILVAVCLTTVTAFVWVRMYTKFCLIKSHGWEDYTSFIAWILLVLFSALNLKCIAAGSGTHGWNIPFQRIELWAKWNNRAGIVYMPTILITKLSILLMYMRLFMPNRQSKTSRLTTFIIWINTLFYLSVQIVSILACIPRRKIWQPWVPGKCCNARAVLLVTAVINVVSDISILLLPIGCIWRLQLSLRRKLGISAVFATASVACIASVVRVVKAINTYHSEDITYDMAAQGNWSYGEVAIGIVCGCMPVLPQFFRHLIPKVNQQLSYHRSKLQGLLSRLRLSSRTTGSSVVLPQASGGDSEALRETKDGKSLLTLGLFGNIGKGLRTMIRDAWPSVLTSNSLFHKTKSTSDDSMDLELQIRECELSRSGSAGTGVE